MTAAAAACAAAALLAALLVALAARSPAQGLAVLLDLLLAAGLLLLAGRPDWVQVGLVAALLAVRALVRAAPVASAMGRLRQG